MGRGLPCWRACPSYLVSFIALLCYASCLCCACRGDKLHAGAAWAGSPAGAHSATSGVSKAASTGEAVAAGEAARQRRRQRWQVAGEVAEVAAVAPGELGCLPPSQVNHVLCHEAFTVEEVLAVTWSQVRVRMHQQAACCLAPHPKPHRGAGLGWCRGDAPAMRRWCHCRAAAGTTCQSTWPQVCTALPPSSRAQTWPRLRQASISLPPSHSSCLQPFLPNYRAARTALLLRVAWRVVLMGGAQRRHLELHRHPGFQYTVQLLEGAVDVMEARACSSALWSLAKLRYNAPPEVLERLAQVPPPAPLRAQRCALRCSPAASCSDELRTEPYPPPSPPLCC